MENFAFAFSAKILYSAKFPLFERFPCVDWKCGICAQQKILKFCAKKTQFSEKMLKFLNKVHIYSTKNVQRICLNCAEKIYTNFEQKLHEEIGSFVNTNMSLNPLIKFVNTPFILKFRVKFNGGIEALKRYFCSVNWTFFYLFSSPN